MLHEMKKKYNLADSMTPGKAIGDGGGAASAARLDCVKATLASRKEAESE